MKSYWVVCTNSKGCKWLKEGHKYLIQPKGTMATILRDEFNPHRRYNPVLKNRFKLIKN